MNGQAPAWEWAKSAGGVGEDGAYRIAVNRNGDSYITGLFSNPSIIFGGTLLTSSGGTDIFIVKYDSLANVIWAKKAGGNDRDAGYGIAIDNNGNSYISGTFRSTTITFDSITLTNTNPPFDDLFIAKYDAFGNILWVRNGIGSSYDQAIDITVDASGYVYVTGSFLSPVLFLGNNILINYSGGSINEIFLAKYDSLGNIIWARSSNGSGTTGAGDYGYSIKADAGGGVYVTGDFYGPTLAFNNTILINNDSSGINNDIYLAKYDSSGNFIWATSVGGHENDGSRTCALDGYGHLYLTGYFESPSVNFGNITLVNISNSYDDIFITKYDTSGNVMWAKSAGGNYQDEGVGIAPDQNGNLYISGDFKSSLITFGITSLVQAGYKDIFIVKLDSAGNTLWAKQIGGSGFEYCNGLGLDANGYLYVAGGYESPMLAFGNTILTNAGNYDVFIAKLDTTFTTGIQEINTSYSISLFPNPTDSHLTITSPATIDEIKISNLLGQVIYHTKPNQKNVELQIDREGVYFVSLTTGTQTVTRKLVVQQ